MCPPLGEGPLAHSDQSPSCSWEESSWARSWARLLGTPHSSLGPVAKACPCWGGSGFSVWRSIGRQIETTFSKINFPSHKGNILVSHWGFPGFSPCSEWRGAISWQGPCRCLITQFLLGCVQAALCCCQDQFMCQEDWPRGPLPSVPQPP